MFKPTLGPNESEDGGCTVHADLGSHHIRALGLGGEQ